MASPHHVRPKKTGGHSKVVDAVLSDDTGSVTLVLWQSQIMHLKKKHSRIRAEEGYLKEYRNELQLSIGQWGIVVTLL